MERKHEDWIEALRDAAAGDGQNPPDGLWHRISARLDVPESGAAGRRRRLYAWAASVAAVAAATILGVFLLRAPAGNWQLDMAADAEISPAGISVPAEITDIPVEEPVLPVDNASGKSMFAGTRISKVVGTSAASEEALVAGIEPQHVPGPESGDVPARKDNEPSTGPDASGKAAGGSVADLDPASPVRSLDIGTRSGRTPGLKGALALSGGGIGSASDGIQVRVPEPVAKAGEPITVPTLMLTPDAYGRMVMATAAPEQYSYRHRQPLTFALSFDCYIGHNLYAGAGVSYTKLSSTVTGKYSGREFDQKLQYVGIPVALKWAFLNRRVVVLYAGAGVQPEFCVDAKFDNHNADVSLMQWSVNLLAGAQLNLGKHIGIYAEPKLSHYFRDTELETVRNTKSVNFNLEFGLRFTY